MVYERGAALKQIPNKFGVSAHGNSIHAVVEYFEDVAKDVIPGMEVPEHSSGLRARGRPQDDCRQVFAAAHGNLRAMLSRRFGSAARGTSFGPRLCFGVA